MIALGLTFIATISYGIIFQVPVRTLIGCGLIGIMAWGIRGEVEFYGLTRSSAILIAAWSVAIMAQIFSRIQKVPATPFIICGIIPLVPGFRAYTAMNHFMSQEIIPGMEAVFETFLSAGAIGAGLIVGESVVRLVKGRRR